jgi:hypothetical protein
MGLVIGKQGGIAVNGASGNDGVWQFYPLLLAQFDGFTANIWRQFNTIKQGQ